MSKNSLEILSRVQKWKMDEQRKILAELLSQEYDIEKMLKKLNEDFVKEKEFCTKNENISGFGLYAKKYREDREKIEDYLKKLAIQIEKQKDIITEMFKEQKTYQIIDENRKKIAEKAINDEEQKFLDEISTNKYIRQQSEG